MSKEPADDVQSIKLLRQWQRHFRACCRLRRRLKERAFNPFRELRVQMGATQGTLAGELGVDVGHLRNVEYGRRRGSAQMLSRLLRIFFAWEEQQP